MYVNVLLHIHTSLRHVIYLLLLRIVSTTVKCLTGKHDIRPCMYVIMFISFYGRKEHSKVFCTQVFETRNI